MRGNVHTIKPDTDYIRSRLSYCSETGVLTWKERTLLPGDSLRDVNRWNSRHAGKPAGRVCEYGYVVVKVDRKAFKAHRLAWVIYHGQWPADGFFIDHINRDKADNRITNLRLVTRSSNGMNRPEPVTNTSGVKGVNWYPPNGRWCARIGVNGKRLHLGYFDTLEEAQTAYENAAKKYHPEVAA